MQKADSTDLDLRFNWNTPFFISPHTPPTLYVGGNRVLKSTEARRRSLSDLARPLDAATSVEDPHGARTTTGGITNDATGAETYGTIMTLAESSMRPGCSTPAPMTATSGSRATTARRGRTSRRASPACRPTTYVVRIEPSHFDTLTFYVAFDNHRSNDFTPYLYVTNDFGKTFRSIVERPAEGRSRLPARDPRGSGQPRTCSSSAPTSARTSRVDRGQSWQRFMSGLPTVPVHDLKIHPRDHELIAATHGRGIWIADVLPLEQMTDSVFAKGAICSRRRSPISTARRRRWGRTRGTRCTR